MGTAAVRARGGVRALRALTPSFCCRYRAVRRDRKPVRVPEHRFAWFVHYCARLRAWQPVVTNGITLRLSCWQHWRAAVTFFRQI